MTILPPIVWGGNITQFISPSCGGDVKFLLIPPHMRGKFLSAPPPIKHHMGGGRIFTIPPQEWGGGMSNHGPVATLQHFYKPTSIDKVTALQSHIRNAFSQKYALIVKRKFETLQIVVQ